MGGNAGCDWTRWRSKLLTRKLMWKCRFSSFKALPAIHSQSSTAAPTRSLSQGVESKLVLQVGDSVLSVVRVLVVPAAPSPSRSVRQLRHQVQKPQPWSSHPCLSPSRHASQRRPMLSLTMLLCRPPVEVGTVGSIQDVAISGLSSGWPNLSAESLTPLGESSIAASSGSTSGVADRS